MRTRCGVRFVQHRLQARLISIGRAMNYSIATADRTTHLKVVVLALFWAILIMGIAIALG
jgi:hypothetical protein